MEYLLPQPADRRPAAETLHELRLSCAWVLASADFGSTLGDRMAELVPSGHPLRSEAVPVQELAVAVLDPVRDPERYGGALDFVESRWQQLGAWAAEVGLPDDACHHLVRAVARAARDVSGEDWDSAASSGWAALQLWMQAHLVAGVQQVRRVGAPAVPGPAQPVDPADQGAHQPDQGAHQPDRPPQQQPLHRPGGPAGGGDQASARAGRVADPPSLDPFTDRPLAPAEATSSAGAARTVRLGRRRPDHVAATRPRGIFEPRSGRQPSAPDLPGGGSGARLR
ncbi:MAG TPA: hypothetical protein VI248_03070 [Kineosporiaceae bacterium]